MGFNFPYGNKQQLNLDWFLRKFKELVAAWNDKEESIDGALDAEIQKAEDALTDVYTARDVAVAAKNDALQAKADALTAAANAAQYWQNAAASANSAATSAVTALQAAQDAADDADQTSRDRASVTADKAAVAADKATVAADKAAVAADKAAVAQDKDDTDLLKDAANAAALRSEGWAVGEQNGTPVTSESPYYQNNSKYFKEEAEAVLESIPEDYSDLAAEVASQGDKIDELTIATLITKLVSGEVCSFNDGAENTPIKSFTPDTGAGTLYQCGKNFFPTSIPANKINATISGGRITSATNARVYGIPCPKNTNFFFQRDAGSTGMVIGTSNKPPAIGDTVRNIATMSNATTKGFNTGTDNYIIVMISAVNTQAQLVGMHAMFTIGSSLKTYEAFKDIKEYTITDGATTEEVKTFEGFNNFWTDTQGTISIEYFTSTSIFINKILESIAPIENNDTASRAYSAGAYFYHNGVFCKASTSIAAGATFTQGTNYTITTVGAELYRLSN